MRRLEWLSSLSLLPLALITMGVGPCDPAPLGSDRRDGGTPGVGGGGSGTGGEQGTGGAPGTGGGIATDGSVDICSLPFVTGPCQAIYYRYGYDPATKQCEWFLFGGCGSNGNNFTTPDECFDRCVPADSCDFTTSYTLSEDGGFDGLPSTFYLDPARSYRRRAWDGNLAADPLAYVSCQTTLPPCRTPGVIDPDDILRDLADKDVAWALSGSQPPFFGHDSRPGDGTAFKIVRADGHGLLVGDPCRDGVDVDCRIPPPGVQRLVDDLRQLDREQRALPACANLHGR